ncbi:AraC family transcriptional regulator [Flavobacterium sp. DG1-102-2]|uniref:helix-turn-helix domain-containing protein n=1 Tax=Flavobacterium sp. DG1-102-2 TaxID=3081663 RepID=UPI002949FD0E|nr:AraC family transcriptional regulator [Flavobacterium sp. DG1-102-2]MDV6169329.1 AraC family transcriptional regulator [Flavobacterium sp. DG1-102-2]
MNHFKTISEYYRHNGFSSPENPLISFVQCTKVDTCSLSREKFTGDFYMIMFKKMKSGVIVYGRTKYDHDNGSLAFIKPHQVMQMDNIELEEDGFIIFVHEDYFNGHHLHSEIKKYGFFDYEANEALHLSPREEEIMWDLFYKMTGENSNNQDEYTREIMLTHLDSILKYSQRFYKRQFINRTQLSGTTVSKFNNLLSSYFDNGKLIGKALPTVKSMAEKLNTSSRYLSDLLKQETGKTAMELIHIYLIGEAKNMLQAAQFSVSETAYTLGFENPPYFTRLFKKEVGLTPGEFRKQFLN